jgi:hypothetical protein
MQEFETNIFVREGATFRGRLEHGNFIGIPKDRNFVGKFSFEPFGT